MSKPFISKIVDIGIRVQNVQYMLIMFPKCF